MELIVISVIAIFLVGGMMGIKIVTLNKSITIERQKRLEEEQIHLARERALEEEIEIQKRRNESKNELLERQNDFYHAQQKRNNYRIRMFSIIVGAIVTLLSENLPLGMLSLGIVEMILPHLE